jgi:hypothetical protein
MAGDARRNRVAAWALAIVLLAVGAVAGVAADRLLGRGARDEPPWPRGPDAVMERLTRDLDLTPAQVAAVRPIVEERWSALETLFVRVDPEAEAIRKATDDRIRALLEPAQRERFEARVAEHERRRAEIRRRTGAAR